MCGRWSWVTICSPGKRSCVESGRPGEVVRGSPAHIPRNAQLDTYCMCLYVVDSEVEGAGEPWKRLRCVNVRTPACTRIHIR
jgi:hypothetical protein